MRLFLLPSSLMQGLQLSRLKSPVKEKKKKHRVGTWGESSSASLRPYIYSAFRPLICLDTFFSYNVAFLLLFLLSSLHHLCVCDIFFFCSVLMITDAWTIEQGQGVKESGFQLHLHYSLIISDWKLLFSFSLFMISGFYFCPHHFSKITFRPNMLSFSLSQCPIPK